MSEDQGMHPHTPRTGRHLIVGNGPIGLATAQALRARGQEVTLAVQRQLQGRAAWWLGDPDKRHSFTYVPDAGLALALLALDEGAWRQTWHLPTQAQAPTPRQLLAETARLLGAPAQVRAIPAGLTRAAALFIPPLAQVSEMLYQFREDYVFGSEKFMARYPDFRITPHAEGLARMVDSLRPAGRA